LTPFARVNAISVWIYKYVYIEGGREGGRERERE